jgi:hypothetical protein
VNARRIGAIIVGVASLAVGFLPLFAGPGYEHAIACGLIVPTVTAIVTANEGFENRHIVSGTPLSVVVRGLETAAIYTAIAITTSLLHGARVGFCDPIGGMATYALTAGLGSVLAGAIGAVSAILCGHVFARDRKRRRWAAFFAGLAPLSSAIVAGALFYYTPAVFAFDPFVGFFSGTLYDEVVEAWRPLLTYRAGTACTLLMIVLAAAGLTRSADGRLLVASRGFMVGALLLLGVSATLIANGEQLGHRSTASSIRRVLGGSRSGPRCEVVYPRATPEREAELLLRDCEEALAAVEARIGFRGPDRVTAFFFKDSEQKRRLMGAADTYIAKPWRREVYLQVAPYPHPVLGHELAHVVAGQVAPGPFHIAGRMRGLFPNPGLIEGIAVAASPDRDELTPQQWARAMKELGLLPKLSRTFGGGFLAQNSSTAYTVAGSFVSHLLATGRGDAIRKWYGGATFESAFGMSFATAEDAWLRSLDDAPLPPEALAVAKARFDRPAIWGRRCPHVVEKLRDEAEECRDDGDYASADDKLRKLLSLDEADPSARMERAKLASKRGDDAAMRSMLQEMIGDARTSTTWRNRAREHLADDDLRHGRLEEARALYEIARKEVLDEDWARTLDVKAWMAASPERASLFGRLLVGKTEQKDETLAATIALARFLEKGTSTDELNLARYLVARRLIEAHAYDDADAMLAATDSESLGRISPRLVREAARLSIVIACLTDKAKVDTALKRYLAAPPANAGRREGVERMAARCK